MVDPLSGAPPGGRPRSRRHRAPRASPGESANWDVRPRSSLPSQVIKHQHIGRAARVACTGIDSFDVRASIRSLVPRRQRPRRLEQNGPYGRRAACTGRAETCCCTPEPDPALFAPRRQGPHHRPGRRREVARNKTISPRQSLPEDPFFPGIERRPPQNATIAARTGEGGPTLHRINRAGLRRFKVVAHDVDNAVAVQVSGRVHPVEGASSLRTDRRETRNLPSNEPHKSARPSPSRLAVLGQERPAIVYRFARRGRQEMDDRRIEHSKDWSGPHRAPGPRRRELPATASRPTSSPPEHRPDGSRLRVHKLGAPVPELVAVFARDRIDVDATWLGQLSRERLHRGADRQIERPKTISRVPSASRSGAASRWTTLSDPLFMPG